MKILITTSGTGSRLGNLTKYTNKTLLRVGNKLTINHIIDHYPQNSEFIITLGYFGNFVKQYLNLCYPNYNFTFVNVDKFKGPGSSLGYSLYQTKNIIKEPFIFHCCDSIITDKFDISKLKNNTFFVYKPTKKNYNMNNLYSTIISKNDKDILKINKKGYPEFDYIYIGISFIKNFKMFFNILEDLIKKNTFKNSLSDIHVAQEILKKNSFNYLLVKNWYDMGTMVNFNNCNNEIKCDYNILQKENESISFVNNKVIKFFYNKTINKNRIIRSKNLKKLIPKIINYSDNFHIMEYIDSKPISEIYNEPFLISKLLNWAKKNLWIENKNTENFKNICFKFYYNKTINRIQDGFKNNKFIDYSKINGIDIGSIDNLIKKIDFNKLSDSKPYNFHGDFILDNILKKNEKFILIDWRQDFGGDLNRGDIYYDFAKLRHNIILNHKNIKNGLFTLITKHDNECIIDLKCNYYLINQLNDFEKFILKNHFNLKKIKILTALIWINMSSLHKYPLSNFLFNFGKYNLYLESLK